MSMSILKNIFVHIGVNNTFLIFWIHGQGRSKAVKTTITTTKMPAHNE